MVEKKGIGKYWDALRKARKFIKEFLVEITGYSNGYGQRIKGNFGKDGGYFTFLEMTGGDWIDMTHGEESVLQRKLSKKFKEIIKPITDDGFRVSISSKHIEHGCYRPQIKIYFNFTPNHR